MLCPVCKNESINKKQCDVCKWEFTYFTEEPTAKELAQYNALLQKHKDKFYGSSKKIVELTSSMLEKTMFETTPEYEQRINSLDYVVVGNVTLESYNADSSLLKFKPTITFKDTKIYGQLYKDFKNTKYEMTMKREIAKKLYEADKHPFIVKLKIENKIIHFSDVMINEYSFMPLYQDLLNAKKQELIKKEQAMQKKIAEDEQAQIAKEKIIEEENEEIKDLPDIWLDEVTNLEWILGFIEKGWLKAPDYKVRALKKNLNNCSTKSSKLFLKKIENECIYGKVFLLYREEPDSITTSLGKSIASFIKKRI